MASTEAKAVVAAFAVMVSANYLAQSSKFGGKDNKTISDENPTYLSPDGKTFAIWGMIYLLELVLVIAQLFGDDSTEELFAKSCPLTGLNVRMRLILAFLVNSIWLPIFNNELFWPAMAIIVAYLALLLSIYSDVNAAATSGPLQALTLAAGISMNTSWLVVATCVSTFLTLGRAGWRDEHGVAGSVPAAMLIIVGVAALGCQRAWCGGDLAWAFVSAWALRGIYRMQTIPDRVRFPLGAMNSTLGNVAWCFSFVVVAVWLVCAARRLNKLVVA